MKKPVLVLLHGAGGNSLSWPVQVRRLHGWRVLAPDMPGHGRSEGVAFQNLAEVTRAVTRFLREVGVYSMVLAGHSLGAAAALEFARSNPDQVKGLALLSAAPHLAVPPDLLQAVSDEGTYPIGLSLLRQRCFSPRTSARPRDRFLSVLEKQRSTILYSDFLAAAGFDYRENGCDFKCPAWIACGKQDLITPPSVSRGLIKLFQQAEFTEIPAAGHLLPLEQPAVVAAGLQSFLHKHNQIIESKPEREWTFAPGL